MTCGKRLGGEFDRLEGGTYMCLNRKRAVVLVLSLMNCAGPLAGSLFAQDDRSPATEGEIKLAAELSVFQPFLGTWEIDGQWQDGTALWARNQYTPELDGTLLKAQTWARNAEGKVYQRYFTVWRYNSASKTIDAHGYMFDGKYNMVESVVIYPGGDKNPIIQSQWKPNPDSAMEIRQQVQITNDNEYSWKVWTSMDGTAWASLMDGSWKRVAK
jgi:hypothetical protein